MLRPFLLFALRLIGRKINLLWRTREKLSSFLQWSSEPNEWTSLNFVSIEAQLKNFNWICFVITLLFEIAWKNSQWTNVEGNRTENRFAKRVEQAIQLLWIKVSADSRVRLGFFICSSFSALFFNFLPTELNLRLRSQTISQNKITLFICFESNELNVYLMHRHSMYPAIFYHNQQI